MQNWLEMQRPKLGPKVNRCPDPIHSLGRISSARVGLVLMYPPTQVDTYKGLFEQNDIDGDALLSLDDLLLQTIGINSCGHRLRLMKLITQALCTLGSPKGRAGSPSGSIGFSDFSFAPSHGPSVGPSLAPSYEPSHAASYNPSSDGRARKNSNAGSRAGSRSMMEARRPANTNASDLVIPNHRTDIRQLRPTQAPVQNSTPIIDESQIVISHLIGSGSQANVYAGPLLQNTKILSE